MDEVRIAYAPTQAEIGKGMKLVCRPIYSGKWKWLMLLHSLLQGMGIGALGFLFAYVIMMLAGIGLSEAPNAYYALFLVISASVLFLGRSIRKRSAEVYSNSSVLKEQVLQVSAKGIGWDNGRSSSLTDWRDTGEIVEDKTTLVCQFANQGFVIPDRILAQAGNPKELRAQIKAWQSDAKGQA